MDVEEKIQKISEMPMGELVLRRKLINAAIKICLLEGDPLDGAKIYREQLGRIDSEIKQRKRAARRNETRKRRRNGKVPEDIIIDAKLARMGAKVNKQ